VPLISLRQLLECGVHFGHPTRKWNPKMNQFIYTKRNGIHILDLQQTVQFIDDTHAYITSLVDRGGKILFVGTKKQAQDAIREEANKCGMPFVASRWLGGLLTNWETMRKRTMRLNELRKQRDEGYFERITKKDARFLGEEMAKLDKFLGGIADLDRLPDALFIVDVKKEKNAVCEARKLGIPIIGILDTNCDPDDVDYKMPGNDDAIRSIRLFCQIVADSVRESKLGYLPPDSVFIHAMGEEAPRAHPVAAPAPAAAPVPAPVPAPEIAAEPAVEPAVEPAPAPAPAPVAPAMPEAPAEA
jgi:small subunit ribosomal protein S2